MKTEHTQENNQSGGIDNNNTYEILLNHDSEKHSNVGFIKKFFKDSDFITKMRLSFNAGNFILHGEEGANIKRNKRDDRLREIDSQIDDIEKIIKERGNPDGEGSKNVFDVLGINISERTSKKLKIKIEKLRVKRGKIKLSREKLLKKENTFKAKRQEIALYTIDKYYEKIRPLKIEEEKIENGLNQSREILKNAPNKNSEYRQQLKEMEEKLKTSSFSFFERRKKEKEIKMAHKIINNNIRKLENNVRLEEGRFEKIKLKILPYQNKFDEYNEILNKKNNKKYESYRDKQIEENREEIIEKRYPVSEPKEEETPTNKSRTPGEPTPTNTSTNSEPEIEKNTESTNDSFSQWDEYENAESTNDFFSQWDEYENTEKNPKPETQTSEVRKDKKKRKNTESTPKPETQTSEGRKDKIEERRKNIKSTLNDFLLQWNGYMPNIKEAKINQKTFLDFVNIDRKRKRKQKTNGNQIVELKTFEILIKEFLKKEGKQKLASKKLKDFISFNARNYNDIKIEFLSNNGYRNITIPKFKIDHKIYLPKYRVRGIIKSIDESLGQATVKLVSNDSEELDSTLTVDIQSMVEDDLRTTLYPRKVMKEKVANEENIQN